ncbi:type I restriction-modification enzyme S subunit [Tolypothrix tenuis PCC 7101]|uniref:Type I restriction-modification enzyme S subunit n=1 Tax=Tolypothrix tenuis PCC 7101 TaxID=231146 RepID=A0A1Z4MSH9_9CYAN|nr:restriction endonuclease subunit S [Aulosira sp. FACHB-113]BAY96420.1 type I restriction-modification enzyme S subunit [Tolypothrix tenuis PCC 7101]BAZ73072.1 type I restriction-modification enzyme S subunit [Aulosira laxa NIES-50]
MELKPGYKQTEVGVIPEDWEVRALLSAVRIAKGQVDPKVEPFRSMTLVAPDHIESRTGRLLERSKASDQGAISGKYLFMPGDIVYSKIRPYLRKAILADFRGLCSADMYPLTPAPDVSPAFMFAVLLSNSFSCFAENVSVRSGIPKINRDELAQYILALPPLPEQKEIAQSLSDVDALVTECDRLITKKRNTKQGTMQQLLTGKKRLPGFSGEWEVKTLGEIGDCIIGLTYKPENVKENGLLVLRSSNIGNNQLKFDDNVYVDVAVPEKLITKQGDILICVRNGSRQLIGKNAIIDKHSEGFTFGAFMCVYRTKFYKYVFHAFQSNGIKRQINENIGATINQITNKNLNSFQILLPPLEEQQAIAQILSDMDAEITALEQKRDKYKAIKQGMMQELLTGKTRLITSS